MSKTTTPTITITQNQYINNLLKIGKQNMSRDDRFFYDEHDREYKRINYTVGKSVVACAAECVKITPLMLRVFYTLCNNFINNGRVYNADSFVRGCLEAFPQTATRQNTTKIKKSIAEQLQNLSRIALYLPTTGDKTRPYTIGIMGENSTTADDIIAKFDFAEGFKSYMSSIATYLEIPKSILQINSKHYPHAFNLIMNIMIVRDIKKHKKQALKDIAMPTLITYCPNLTEYQRSGRKTIRGYEKREIMTPIFDTLQSCATPYFNYEFIGKDGQNIGDFSAISYKEWIETKLKIKAITKKTATTGDA